MKVVPDPLHKQVVHVERGDLHGDVLLLHHHLHLAHEHPQTAEAVTLRTVLRRTVH